MPASLGSRWWPGVTAAASQKSTARSAKIRSDSEADLHHAQVPVNMGRLQAGRTIHRNHSTAGYGRNIPLGATES